MKALLILFLFVCTAARAQVDSLLLSHQIAEPASFVEAGQSGDFFEAGQPKEKLVTYVPPALFVAYGFVALSNRSLVEVDRSVFREVRQDHPHFATAIDDYLQYSPAMAACVLNIAGLRGAHPVKDQMALYVISSGIMGGSVTILKKATRQLRPNGRAHSSFPSGHTATAFAAAEFVNQEFGSRSPLFGIAAYSAAATTGILRVYNNAHWFSNVVAGAGLGILSTKAAYKLYPGIRHLLKEKGKIKIMPYYADKAVGASVTAKL